MGFFMCLTVDEFLPAEEFLESDSGGESYTLIEEGSERWEMMGLGGTN